jgi:hypothetical protein
MAVPTTTSLPSPFARTTPVPNRILDDHLPELSGAEAKVLLVVLRQTLGWSVGGDPRRRKARDWITQSQFKRRAGLASEAVSRSIDGLVRRGLVTVEDEAGAPLDTPAARRAHRGRLYYRCRPGAVEERGGPPAPCGTGEPGKAVAKAPASTPSSEAEHRQANTTKREEYKSRIRETLRRANAPSCAGARATVHPSP